MNWRSKVVPLWAKTAANGPWYQVESKPVMPVPRRGGRRPRSGRPPAPATASAGQPDRACRVELGRRLGERRRRRRPASAAASADRRGASAASTQPGLAEQPDGAEQLGDQSSSAAASTAVGEPGRRPVQPGSSRERSRTPRQHGAADDQQPAPPPRAGSRRRSSIDGAQPRRRRRRMIWSSSATRSSLSQRQVDERRRRRAPPIRETIWAPSERPSASSSSSQTP